MKTAAQENNLQGVNTLFSLGVILPLVYLRSKRRVPSTKAANSPIPWLTPTVLRSTTEFPPRCISTETEGRCARSPPRGREGATTRRWNDKLLAYSAAGTVQPMGGSSWQPEKGLLFRCLNHGGNRNEKKQLFCRIDLHRNSWDWCRISIYHV